MMSVTTLSKRKRPGGSQEKAVFRPRKSKRASSYHSSSDDDDDEDGNGAGVQLPNLLDTTDIPDAEAYQHSEEQEERESDNTSNSGDNSDSEQASQTSLSEDPEQDEDDDNEDDEEAEDDEADPSERMRKPRKRNDPAQFATSISKILSSKLTKDKRADPVLSRSKDATELSKELAEDRLEAKARRKLRDDRRAALNKGREKDVLGLNREDVSAGAVVEEERQLKKTAQRGVVKLFNAVRAAQVKGEIAAQEVKEKGVVGTDRRQEKVNEMSKKGFLDLLVDGGR